MEQMPLTAADVAAVTNNRGYGYCDGMYGSEWFWIIIILFFAWGNNGWGNRGCDNNCTEQFIERDIFTTNQNVSNTACQTQRDVLENSVEIHNPLWITYNEDIDIMSIIKIYGVELIEFNIKKYNTAEKISEIIKKIKYKQ